MPVTSSLQELLQWAFLHLHLKALLVTYDSNSSCIVSLHCCCPQQMALLWQPSQPTESISSALSGMELLLA